MSSAPCFLPGGGGEIGGVSSWANEMVEGRAEQHREEGGQQQRSFSSSAEEG